MTRMRRKITARIPAVTRKTRPGKDEIESRHSWSKRGTKASGMRDSRRATKVLIFPSSEGRAIRAMMILQTDGTVPIGDQSEFRWSVTCSPPTTPSPLPIYRAEVD